MIAEDWLLKTDHCTLFRVTLAGGFQRSSLGAALNDRSLSLSEAGAAYSSRSKRLLM
jgi:hypothetical protein